MKHFVYSFFVIIVLFIFISCPDAEQDDSSLFSSSIEKVIIPLIKIQDGGIQSSLAPGGEVYYYNALNSREESDIQLHEPISYTMTAKRYLYVGGYAVPDDSGSADTFYHAVLFWARLMDASGNVVETHYYTFPVDDDNIFDGYIYFREAGRYLVYSIRFYDHFLYPRTSGTTYTVDEWSSTLRFEVFNTEDIPDNLEHLLPTRDIDNGTKAIQDKALELTANSPTDLEKVQEIYKFLVFGDPGNGFTYSFYYEIYPGYLTSSYADIFIASHFLENRIGVCNDFAELFAALTRSLGFHVQTIRGVNSGNSAAHRWNRISLDGGASWLRIDTTFSNLNKDDAPDYYKKYGEIYPEFNEPLFLNNIENYYDDKDPAYPKY